MKKGCIDKDEERLYFKKLFTIVFEFKNYCFPACWNVTIFTGTQIALQYKLDTDSADLI